MCGMVQYGAITKYFLGRKVDERVRNLVVVVMSLVLVFSMCMVAGAAETTLPGQCPSGGQGPGL